jgi:hypothetical protein
MTFLDQLREDESGVIGLTRDRKCILELKAMIDELKQKIDELENRIIDLELRKE